MQNHMPGFGSSNYIFTSTQPFTTGTFAIPSGSAAIGAATTLTGTPSQLIPDWQVNPTSNILSPRASSDLTLGAEAYASGLTPQTITFNNPGSQTVGVNLNLVATATSGLIVTFTSTTTSVCTVSGTTATFLTSGTCTIDANQSGNASYSAAPMVPQSFPVNAAPSNNITVTTSNISTSNVSIP